ncbi:hypothetical protein METHB2_430015 [Candidatus Methylobacter favarea]|uniref:Tc1-like transposase DDE domain-containing protein n=1 Tax=Candidatus Methylobacter favarea TaxID=2707345 RepID=A0A8S0XTE8_9GAMM|nr:hypothetical protein METHB2_430015 [Candidatus Methylobacter favarea]
MDGALFKAYVHEFLCPTLSPGDIVVRDNLSSHQVAGIREAIRAVAGSSSHCRLTAGISIPSNRCLPG